MSNGLTNFSVHTRVDPRRIRQLRHQSAQPSPKAGPILYWMIRDMRVQDNWALLYALELAQQSNTWVEVVFALRSDLDKHLGTARLLDSLIGGLREIEKELRRLGIGFRFLLGEPVDQVMLETTRIQPQAVVLDFSPLQPYRNWHSELSKQVGCPVFQVDAHNIVPCWHASNKAEYSARTGGKL